MRFDAYVELVATAYAPDALGQQVPVRTTRGVYANEFTVGHAEFYEAGAVGLRPERQFQIRSCEYAGERLLLAGDEEFSIIRVERRGEWTRLTCEKVLGSG